MDKQKQIEEIKEALPSIEIVRNLYDDFSLAEWLYDMGIRKIHKGAVVLTREEWDKLKEITVKLRSGNEIKIDSDNFAEIVEIIYNEARKEMAEKYHTKVIEAIDSVPNATKEFVEAWKAKNDEIAKEITEG